jgi:hypothetical protein
VLDASWQNFNWEKYPGGVHVSFALTNSNHVLLIRPQRWNYVMPQRSMARKDTLEGVVSAMYAELKALGIAFGVSRQNPPSVERVVAENRSLYILVQVPYTSVSAASSQVERVGSALMLGGFSVSNPMVGFVPPMLKWSDAVGVERQLLAA